MAEQQNRVIRGMRGFAGRWGRIIRRVTDQNSEGRVGIEFGFGNANGLGSGRSSEMDVDDWDLVRLNSQGESGRVTGRRKGWVDGGRMGNQRVRR